ncbi:MAG: glycosyltransferase family 39 protein [Kastovskya adunca ATA6-11-RM4]|jgi:4-amino-4-deoxy-L-arabinose transferase-like glycosyltransferase|nr:glycosyltransferase family 39 protein [Kastovskya adunca ATA6-11-RM4]
MDFRVKYAVMDWWKSYEKQPAIAWGFSVLWLLLISALAFLWNLGSIGLVDETEPLFAEASRQMLETGDWITPYFNGETRFDKPALIYWTQAIAYKLIGVNEWAVRLPSALAAIALMVLGFYTLRYFGFTRPAAVQSDDSSRQPLKIRARQRQLWLSAWLGSAIIAFTPETIVWAHTGVSDMLLSACIGMALLCFFIGYAQNEPGREDLRPISHTPIPSSVWYLAFYVLSALAVLTKGPVGIVLPVLVVGAFLLYLGKFWEVLKETRPIRGGLIFVAIALPWYVLVTLANPKTYIESFFGYHNVERFTNVVNGHSAPWYFYFLVVLVGFAPWSIYLPLAIARIRFWQRERWRAAPRSTHLGLFALFWFGGIFGFFSIAVTKLPSYVLPLMPAAAILVALLWSEEISRVGEAKGAGERGSGGAGKNLLPFILHPSSFILSPRLRTQDSALLISGIVNVLFLFAVAAASFYMPRLIGPDPAAPNLVEQVQQIGLPWRGGVIWSLTAIAATICLLRRSWWRWLWSVNFVGFIAFFIFMLTPAYFLIDTQRQLPLRQLSFSAVQEAKPREELIMVGFKKPSVVFYSQRSVIYLSPEGVSEYITSTSQQEKEPTSFLMLGRPKDISRIGLQPNQYRTLEVAGGYELIRVLPQEVVAIYPNGKQGFLDPGEVEDDRSRKKASPETPNYSTST